LIEPIAGDPDNMAVTFLWRGLPNTRNVLVLWLPYAGAAPDEYLMARLGQTDAWYKTIKVDRKMRLSYTLAPNAARLLPLSLGIDSDALTMIATSARPDPLNPKRWRDDSRSVDAPEFRVVRSSRCPTPRRNRGSPGGQAFPRDVSRSINSRAWL